MAKESKELRELRKEFHKVTGLSSSDINMELYKIVDDIIKAGFGNYQGMALMTLALGFFKEEAAIGMGHRNLTELAKTLSKIADVVEEKEGYELSDKMFDAASRGIMPTRYCDLASNYVVDIDEEPV